MTPAELRAWVRESRAAQGLPPTVTDTAALDEGARIMVGALAAQIRERREAKAAPRRRRRAS